MSSAEGALPQPSGLGRLIDLRFSWEDGALVVRPPLLGFLIGGVATAIGVGVVANGLWGRTGDAGQVAFGVLYACAALWALLVTARRWISADDAGLRVGVIRQIPVPWDDLEGLVVRGASARGLTPLNLRIERRDGRSLRLVPVFGVRSYGRTAELRYVAKRLAIEAERRGHGPVRWPEELTYRDRNGEIHRVA